MKTPFHFTLLLMFATVASHAQVTLGTSLTACYALNGNGTEPVSNLTGTLSAVTPTVDRFNNPASALAFNGSTASYVELPNSPLLKPNAISVSCWVKLNSNQNSQVIMYTHNGCASFYEGYQLGYNITGNFYRFEVVKSNAMCSPQGQTTIYSGTSTIQAQTWYHVGFYAAADTMKLYVNGTEEAYTSIPQPLVYSPTTGVILGGTNNTPNQPFSGVLDNVRFYNRKLANTEMMQLYTQDPQCLSGLLSVSAFTAPTNICRDQPITLVDQSSNNPTAWSWQMNGGSPATSTLSSPVVSFSTAGIYTVALTTSNSFGAGNTFTQTVTVNLCTSTKELSKTMAVQVFPNPTRGRFVVEPGTNKPVVFMVFNTLGMKVLELASANGDALQVDLTNQPEGVYLLRCQELGLVRKVVVER